MHKKPTKQAKPWLKKRGVRWPLVSLVGAALMVVIIIGTMAGTLGSKGMLRAALRMGRLAELPRAATQVQCDGTGGSSAGMYFIKFTAPAEEIEKFIADSTELRVRAPEALGPERMYLPESQRSTSAAATAAHIYYTPDARYPWFDPALREKGRRYVIPLDRESNSGEVIIDDATQTVYIRVQHH